MSIDNQSEQISEEMIEGEELTSPETAENEEFQRPPHLFPLHVP